MLADEQREMQQICEGNIAVVVGMKHVRTIILLTIIYYTHACTCHVMYL